jgi:hypothetical protein
LAATAKYVEGAAPIKRKYQSFVLKIRIGSLGAPYTEFIKSLSVDALAACISLSTASANPILEKLTPNQTTTVQRIIRSFANILRSSLNETLSGS